MFGIYKEPKGGVDSALRSLRLICWCWNSTSSVPLVEFSDVLVGSLREMMDQLFLSLSLSMLSTPARERNSRKRRTSETSLLDAWCVCAL